MIDLSNNIYIYENIKAHAQGRNVLVLRHLSSPVKRFDGKRVSYHLKHLWLSKTPTMDGDEVCCVQGSEETFWSKRELVENGALKAHSSLFDCFNLF